jgi:hypothetical protein
MGVVTREDLYTVLLAGSRNISHTRSEGRRHDGVVVQ